MLASDIAGRLIELRAALGWNQTRMGQEVGRDRGAIHRWEAGKVRPPLEVLYAVAGKHGWPRAIFEEGGPRPGDVVQGARPLLPAPRAHDRLQIVLAHAFARVAPYFTTGEPVPIKVVMDLLAGLSQELEGEPRPPPRRPSLPPGAPRAGDR